MLGKPKRPQNAAHLSERRSCSFVLLCVFVVDFFHHKGTKRDACPRSERGGDGAVSVQINNDAGIARCAGSRSPPCRPADVPLLFASTTSRASFRATARVFPRRKMAFAYTP